MPRVWLVLLSLLSPFASPVLAATGLNFPDNPTVPNGQTAAFVFTDVVNNGLPIWGANGAGVTYIWKIKPAQQTGYYTTFFWSNNTGAGTLADDFEWKNGPGGLPDTYYGAHPYPDSGNSSGATHSWEISAEQNDFTNGAVVKGQWYTQAFRASGTNGATKVMEFYWDLPNTDVSHRVTRNGNTSYGNINPPSPALTWGDAPWQPGQETCSCILRGIQIYNALLSLADIQSEINSPLSTVAGAASIWYLNLNPTPDDITDKSGRGHNPVWAGSLRPTLYDDGQSDSTPPAAPRNLRIQ